MLATPLPSAYPQLRGQGHVPKGERVAAAVALAPRNEGGPPGPGRRGSRLLLKSDYTLMLLDEILGRRPEHWETRPKAKVTCGGHD